MLCQVQTRRKTANRLLSLSLLAQLSGRAFWPENKYDPVLGTTLVLS